MSITLTVFYTTCFFSAVTAGNFTTPLFCFFAIMNAPSVAAACGWHSSDIAVTVARAPIGAHGVFGRYAGRHARIVPITARIGECGFLSIQLDLIINNDIIACFRQSRHLAIKISATVGAIGLS
jgi:hypothetical protein